MPASTILVGGIFGITQVIDITPTLRAKKEKRKAMQIQKFIDEVVDASNYTPLSGSPDKEVIVRTPDGKEYVIDEFELVYGEYGHVLIIKVAEEGTGL